LWSRPRLRRRAVADAGASKRGHCPGALCRYTGRHTGWAARSALAAVQLARSGFTAALDVLEAPAGFFAAYGVEASCPESALSRLGNPWIIVDPGLALKRFPCCYASHRGMDGVLQLRQCLGLNAENLERLECRMPPGGM